MAYCGIDPGRDKFGLAVAGGTGGENLLFSAILPLTAIGIVSECLHSGDFGDVSEWRAENLSKLLVFDIRALFVGNGTGLDFFRRKFDESGILYNIINERMTTLEGRDLYWKLHPPSGLWKYIPLSLRTPGRPIDDLAAWAILMRGIKNDPVLT
jgi:hypothetical protein